MVTTDFPYCCTAKILAGFGESDVAEGGNRKYSEEKIEEYILERIDIYGTPGAFSGLAALVVTTNSEQKTTNKVLRKLGFRHSQWMTKHQHPETKIRIWWYHLNSKRTGDKHG